MPKGGWKTRRTLIVVVLGVAAIAFFGYRYWQEKQAALPDGIASGNGRIEAKLIDASAKEALRVKEILVDEGDLVKPGQVLVKLDTATIDAELAAAKAAVAAAEEQLAVANAEIAKSKSEINLAQIEAERARKLVAEKAGSQREYDVRKMAAETTRSALAENEAKLESAKRNVEVAQDNVATIQTRIDDATLTSPARGRVLYRLVEPGEVLAAGGKALTLVNLDDVYMEIFLPAEQASAVAIGSDARLTVDSLPGRAAKAFVSFVSPEAQFTPKAVETKTEREKLMFRVKIQVPQALVDHYIERIKTGVRGVGYVKVDPNVEWPASLQSNLLGADETNPTKPGTPAAAESTATTP